MLKVLHLRKQLPRSDADVGSRASVFILGACVSEAEALCINLRG